MDQKKSNGENLHHEYDGITELNNPAPFWWQFIFYSSLVWSLGYVFYYEVLNGPTLTQDLAQDMVQLQVAQSKAQANQNNVSETILAALLKDDSAKSRGKGVYDGKCASCHGPAGGGIVGPNLTDNSWINGDGSLTAIYRLVDQGVAEKGMPPWGPLLKAQELKEVVAFVASLKGTNPPGGKAPQGIVVK